MNRTMKVQSMIAGSIVIVAAAAIVGYSALRTPRVPSGQRAFVVLTAGNLPELKGAFNAGAEHVRVIAFLSPT